MIPSIHDDLFVIESDTLNNVSSSFCGYSNTSRSSENGDPVSLAESDDSLTRNGAKPQPGGAWVRIDRNSDHIEISQDFFGCYGLYLYRTSDFFALSNSFQILAERIKARGLSITVNDDYLRHFIVSDLCSISFSETPFKEITLLPRNATVRIDANRQSSPHIKFIDYGEGSLEIDTASGIQQLDIWYEKWVNAICDLISRGQKVVTDLSGGLDSRLVLSLFLNPSIQLEDVQIHTLEDHSHTHVEDYNIATSIAKRFGFELNSHNYYASTSNRPFCLSESLDISLYLKNGFHKQMYWQRSARETPINQFSGSGGECLRSYWNETPGRFLEKRLFDTYALPADAVGDYSTSLKKVMKKSLDEISNHYNLDRSSVELTEALYRETRCRFHFGKDLVENYYGGIIKHAPLMDENLYRIKTRSDRCPDDNLLTAVLLDRFAPELLDIPIEGNRSISAQTIEYAREINRSFPRRPNEPFSSANNRKREDDNQMAHASAPRPDGPSPNDFFESITHGIDFKQSFERFDSSGVFEYQVSRYERLDWQPLSAIYPLAACSNALYLAGNDAPIPISSYLIDMEGSKNAVNLPRKNYPSVLEKLNTAHIEVVFETSDPSKIDLELVEGGRVQVRRISEAADSEAGCTYALIGHDNVLRARFSVPPNCGVRILLRGPKCLSKKKTDIPIYCRYTTLMVNGEKILAAPINATFNDYECVSLGEPKQSVLDIEANWVPSLKANRLAARTVKLEKEVKRLKRQISKIKQSRSFAVEKALTSLPQAIKKRLGR